jgi:hypothetical protein
MQERRKEKRLKDKNEIAVTIVDDEKKPVQGEMFNNHSIDISVSGAKIQSNIFLPVDTLITIKMKLKNLGKMILIGKVKWTDVIFNDKLYEAGVEFLEKPPELEEYISRGVDIHSFDDK